MDFSHRKLQKVFVKHSLATGDSMSIQVSYLCEAQVNPKSPQCAGIESRTYAKGMLDDRPLELSFGFASKWGQQTGFRGAKFGNDSWPLKADVYSL